ncbi:MAG: UPF0182 family protein [Bacteroidetes bacterium SW_9_63_38]|nr:MAG: UPF0182 family protein [Bacteroidetes bacterium SW_9_63_38]
MSLLRSSRPLQVLLGIIGLVLTTFLFAPDLLVEYLWLGELGYEGVFWTIRTTQVVLFLIVFAVAGLYFGGNFLLLLRRIPPLWASQWAQGGEAPTVGGEPLTRDRLKRFAYVLAAVLSLLFATGFSGRWDDVLRFWYAASYGQADPIYGHDLAFHMLELPFIQALQSAVVGLAFLGLLVLGTSYVVAGEIGIQNGQFRVKEGPLRHLGGNVILLLLGWAVGFYLDRFEMLQEGGGGAVFGAGYTDINVVLPALWLMIGATLTLAGLVAYNLYRRNLRLLGFGVLGYVVVLVGALVAAPALVTQVTVLPSEFQMEKPYLEHNIEMTREAYGLEDFKEESYPAKPSLPPDAVADNQETIDNVRLWDPRLLIDTYRQLQEIRLYYEFYSVDVDRYMIDGDYRQVMVSPRELTQQLPEDTWDNRHVRFTHGYGSVANLVAREGTEGDPEFLARDIPPQTEHEALDVEDPSMYYGENTPHYRTVPAGNPDGEPLELHYPKSGENVYTRYEGDGGVSVGSFWKQLLFSYFLGDFNILLTNYIEDNSRIQFWNRVPERVNRVAPFLKLDNDPYLVLGDDRQYWMVDAYTTSNSFPYSEPIRDQRNYQGTRYIRNSVKVVVDAYSGEVSLYVANPDDPILQTYQKIFPDLFQPLDAMPERLQDHIRYPQDFFEMQVERYRRYHQTQPQVFYNNEDLWTRPKEQYADRQRRMEPYYILTDLPGERADEGTTEKGLEFMLMLPMTPEGRDNMISWVAARSDPPNYGEVVVYDLPKERLIRGPNQIESRIDQDTEISRQLSLWDQRGSNVIRGNLIVVPIEESFLYVEPIFLVAEEIQIPEMQRVIAATDQRVAMKQTLRQSLNSVLGEEVVETRQKALANMQQAAGAAQRASPQRIEELEEAKDLIKKARTALQDGDFAQFGERFKKLENVLNEVSLSDTTTAPAAPTPSSGVDTTAAPASPASADTVSAGRY